MSFVSILTEISEHLHSWKSSAELRSRLLNAIQRLMSSQQSPKPDKEQQRLFDDLFSSITTSILPQPALGHDEPVLTSMLQVLLLRCLPTTTTTTTTTTKTEIVIHSRHIAAAVAALQNHRRAASSDLHVKKLLLELIYTLTKLQQQQQQQQQQSTSSSSSSQVSLIPADSVASAMSCLLDLDEYFAFILSAAPADDATEADNAEQFRKYYFSLLQTFVVSRSSGSNECVRSGSKSSGSQNFIKFGGPAMFSTKKLLVPTTNACSSVSCSSRGLILSAVSVLHAATTSLDVCSEANKFGLVGDVVALLDHVIVAAASSSSSSSAPSSASETNFNKLIALHCLGVIQNVLREIGCSKQFWKNERNISVIVKAALCQGCGDGGGDVDESIKAQSMVILLANAANCEREKAKESNSTATSITIKQDLKRCLTAAHTISLIEDVVT